MNFIYNNQKWTIILSKYDIRDTNLHNNLLPAKNRWGINEQIKGHAQRIADNTNTLAVVPDLYKGKLGLSKEVSLFFNAFFFS